MKKSYIIFLNLFITTISFAQLEKINVVSSPILKVEKNSTKLLFSESDGNGGVLKVSKFYSGSNKHQGTYVEHYDSNLKLVNSTEFDEEREISGVIIKDNVVNLIEYTFTNNKHMYNVLSSTLKALNFKRTELFSLTYEEMNKNFGGLSKKEFEKLNTDLDYLNISEVYFSENKNFFAFDFDLKIQNQSYFHKVITYNATFDKVNEYTFQPDFTDGFFDYEKVTISDYDGSVYLLGKFEKVEDKKIKDVTKRNDYYMLYKLGDTDQKKLSFNTENNLIEASLSAVIKENEVTVVGFYREENAWKYKGVCLYKIDANTLELQNKYFSPFSAQFVSSKYEKEETKVIKDLQFKSVFMHSNGDIIINAEEFYSKNSLASAKYNDLYNNIDYIIYGDIISVRIDSTGNLLWNRIIKKSLKNEINYGLNLNLAKNMNNIYQWSSEFSFSDMFINDTVYFFMAPMEEIKISNDKIKIVWNGDRNDKANLFVISINKDGDFDFKQITDNTKNEIVYPLNKGIVANNGIILLSKSLNKRERIFKIAL